MIDRRACLAELAPAFGEVVTAWDAHDGARASRLADATLPSLRAIAEEHPGVFGEAVEVVADLRRAADGASATHGPSREGRAGPGTPDRAARSRRWR